MPTRKDLKKKKQQQQQQQQQKPGAEASPVVEGKEEEEDEASGPSMSNYTLSPTPTLKTDEMVARSLVKERAPLEDNITCTGQIISQSLSRDLKIENFTLSLYGKELITDATLEFNFGRRYGLLGLNGSGKSTLLTALGRREIKIPDHISIFHLDREIEATEQTALEAVIGDIEEQRIRLEKEAEELATTEEGAASDRIMDIYNVLDELEVETAPKRAGEILHGLGFTKEMQAKKTKDFSGGWRMRVALARALFVLPTMLLLDEPTNHLDLEACVWLEEYLKTYNRILVMISHSQDFLNNVCTNIINLKDKNIKYYTGNYDQYVKTRAELEENQMKQYTKEQEQIAHMKEYIARFGHGSAKLARQAQSKEKTMARMIEGGLTERVVTDSQFIFSFTDVGKLPPPVLTFNGVSYGYSADKILYKDLEFGLDLDSRVALVGPNGAGKSTLLKLIVGDITPVNGLVRRHNKLSIGWYHQHLCDQLDENMSPLQWMLQQFPGTETEAMRRVVGRYGITGQIQTLPIRCLSDGQKSRVVFGWLAHQEPHMLLLDEPTNHLDMETIDALADAINNWDGGLVLVSHDFRLINQVAKEIWVCENKRVLPWKGNIMDYKSYLRKRMLEEQGK
jgi:ATP-binding cassette subfamily F protein 2